MAHEHKEMEATAQSLVDDFPSGGYSQDSFDLKSNSGDISEPDGVNSKDQDLMGNDEQFGFNSQSKIEINNNSSVVFGNDSSYFEYVRPFSYESVPTRKPIVQSVQNFLSVTRTTACDIMCTLSTSIMVNPPESKFKGVSIEFPYKETKTLKKEIQGVTPFQKLKIAEAHKKRNNELTEEKLEFFGRLNQEKRRKYLRDKAASIKIQALFRGWRCRINKLIVENANKKYGITFNSQQLEIIKRMKHLGRKIYIRKVKAKKLSTLVELQDELCKLASKVSLKPIPGLNIESRYKASKRREKIMFAASLRVCKFFRMIVARKKARHRMTMYRLSLVSNASYVIIRFFKFIKVRTLRGKLNKLKQIETATQIQCFVRIFLAKRKVRYHRMKKLRDRQVKEAHTIIYRNYFAPLYSLAKDALWKKKMKQEEKLVNALCDGSLDIIEQIVVNSIVEEELEKEQQIYIQELLRKLAEERKRLEEEEMRRKEEEARRLKEELLRIEEEKRIAEEKRLVEEKRKADEAARIREERRQAEELKQKLREAEEARKRAEEEAAAAEAARILQEKKDAEEAEKKRIAAQEAEERRLMELEMDELDGAPTSARGLTLVTVRTQDILLPLSEKEFGRYISDILDAGVVTVAEIKTKTLVTMAGVLVDNSILQVMDSILDSVEINSLKDDITKEGGNRGVGGSGTGPDVGFDSLSEITAADQSIDKLDNASLGEKTKGEEEEEEDESLLNSADEAISSSEAKYFLGKIDESLSEAQAFLEVLEKIPAEHSSENYAAIRVRLLAHVGLIYKAKSNFEMSKNFYENAYSISSKLMGDDSMMSISVLISIGDLHRSFSNFTEAKVRYSTALSATKSMMKRLSLETGSRAGSRFGSPVKGSAAHDSLSRASKNSSETVKMDRESAKGEYIRILIGIATIQKDQGLHSNFLSSLDELQLLLNSFPVNFVVEAEYFFLLSHLHKLKGNFKEAQAAVQRIRDLYESNEATGSHLDAVALDESAYISLYQSNISQAGISIERSLKLREQCFGIDHPSIADSLHLKALLQLQYGDYNTAEKSAQKALTLRMSSFGEQHPTVHKTLLLLGNLHRSRGYPNVADACFNDANSLLQGFSKSKEFKLFSDNFETQTSMCEMLTAKGAISEAIDGFKTAVAMAEEVQSLFDTNDIYPALELCRLNLALAYILRGNIDEAKPIISQCATILNEKFGESHFYSAKCMFVLGVYCSMKGKHVEAKSTFKRAMDINVKVLGKFPSEFMLQCLLAASQNCSRMGLYQNSIQLAELALNLIRSSCGDKTIHEAFALQCFAEALRDQGRVEDADKLYLATNALLVDILGKNNMHYSKFLGSLGEFFRVSNRLDDAEKCLQDALWTQKKYLSEKNISIAETLCSLALCKYDKEDLEGSRLSFEKEVVPYATEALGTAHPLTHFSIAYLAMITHQLSGVSEVDDETQEAVDNALEFFDVSEFGENHPYVLRLGGFDSESTNPNSRDGRDSTRDGMSTQRSILSSARSDGSTSRSPRHSRRDPKVSSREGGVGVEVVVHVPSEKPEPAPTPASTAVAEGDDNDNTSAAATATATANATTTVTANTSIVVDSTLGGDKDNDAVGSDAV